MENEYSPSSVASSIAGAIADMLPWVEAVATVRTTDVTENAIILKTNDGGSFLVHVKPFVAPA